MFIMNNQHLCTIHFLLTYKYMLSLIKMFYLFFKIHLYKNMFFYHLKKHRNPYEFYN